MLLVGLSGCSADDVLDITHFALFNQVNQCGITPATPSIDRGTLDVALLPSSSLWAYLAGPIVRYNALGGQKIQITGYDIELQLSSDLVPQVHTPTKFFHPIEGGLEQAPVMVNGETPYTDWATGAYVIPIQLGLELAPLIQSGGSNARLVTAHMRARGTGPDGDVTGPFVDFPIDVCRGCLSATSTSACWPWQF